MLPLIQTSPALAECHVCQNCIEASSSAVSGPVNGATACAVPTALNCTWCVCSYAKCNTMYRTALVTDALWQPVGMLKLHAVFRTRSNWWRGKLLFYQSVKLPLSSTSMNIACTLSYGHTKHRLPTLCLPTQLYLPLQCITICTQAHQAGLCVPMLHQVSTTFAVLCSW